MTTPDTDQLVKKQDEKDLARIANVSMNIRQAVRDALPAPAEQFFTVMIPGKVLNLDVSHILRHMSSFSYTLIWDLLLHRTLPKASTKRES